MDARVNCFYEDELINVSAQCNRNKSEFMQNIIIYYRKIKSFRHTDKTIVRTIYHA